MWSFISSHKVIKSKSSVSFFLLTLYSTSKNLLHVHLINYMLLLINNDSINKSIMIVFNKLGEHIASFYWWSKEWSRKSGTEDLDFILSRVWHIFLSSCSQVFSLLNVKFNSIFEPHKSSILAYCDLLVIGTPYYLF